MSRLENTAKNFIWSTISVSISSILGFISRTIFIYTIGSLYLGVNGLFTNILSMLSFTELGISAAINFSLYKPLANNNVEEIKSLMRLYKKSYRIIAIVIFLIGVSLTPFLDYLVKGAEGIENIKFIYLVFLFNSSYSYLFTYKRTLLSADQKSYLMTNIDMIVNILTLIIQIIILIVFKNYYTYLIMGVIIGIIQNIYINNYINKRYPYLLEKDIKPLDKENKSCIVKNIKAMMFHKVGDLCINQTDNIIISSFINVTTVGIISNYTLIINIINKFAMNFFNSANASLGNLIVTENKERRLEVFNGYNFMAFWIFGWTSICFITLLNPFITLWIGEDKIINQSVLFLIIINYYLVGMRVPIGNMKSAAGLYVQDQFVPIIQSIVNLIVSIIGVQKLGLIGIYIGTITSSIILPCWYRPLIVYKYVFEKSSKEYFKKYMIYLAVIINAYYLTQVINNTLFASNITWLTLLGRGIVCLIVPNFIIYILFYKSDDFKYILKIIKDIKYKFFNNKKGFNTYVKTNG